MLHDGQPRSSWLTTLGWACYLACSWTWCIGMFLPVLLVRDYGIWGFVVFAVPNVLGAAAMGWILRRTGASATILLRNARACRWFSGVTLSFHVFALWWLLPALGGWSIAAPWVVFVIALLASVIAASPTRPFPLGAIVVWLASVLCAAVLAAHGALEWPDTAAAPPSARIESIAPLAAACAFGFFLCPYLDLTFHHARRSHPGPGGTAAFAGGFGGFFLAMILFTLAYAPLLRIEDRGLSLSAPAAAAPWLAAHLLLQGVFTFMVHQALMLRGLARTQGQTFSARGLGAAALVVLGVLAVPILAASFQGLVPDHAGLTFGEIVYRLFMGFYGLVFPAYVWICMIPTREGHSGVGGPVGRLRLGLWLAAVLLAAPGFWMGFIERQPGWLIPALAIVLLARLVIPGGRGFGRLPLEPSGAPGPTQTHPPRSHAPGPPEQNPHGG